MNSPFLPIPYRGCIWTVLRITRLLLASWQFAGHVVGSWPVKSKKNASNDNAICYTSQLKTSDWRRTCHVSRCAKQQLELSTGTWSGRAPWNRCKFAVPVGFKHLILSQFSFEEGGGEWAKGAEGLYPEWEYQRNKNKIVSERRDKTYIEDFYTLPMLQLNWRRLVKCTLSSGFHPRLFYLGNLIKLIFDQLSEGLPGRVVFLKKKKINKHESGVRMSTEEVLMLEKSVSRVVLAVNLPL